MKSIWKGSIAFGLVNIPVRLFSTTESQSLASHMLHKKDLSRIRFQRVATIESNRPPISASLALPWLDELAVALFVGHGLPFLKKCSIDLRVKFLLSIHCRKTA